MAQFKTDKPATITANCRGYINVKDERGRLWYFRAADTNCPRLVSFNLPIAGSYSMDADLVRIEPLKKCSVDITLPPAERDHKPPQITFKRNPAIKSPARIFPASGIVEMNDEFFTFPPPVRVFILLHELGHLKYKTEEYCDRFAVKKFLQHGYNPSTAIYSLTRVLNPSINNRNRVIELLKQIAI